MRSENFEFVDWKTIRENPSGLIGDGWMLITPGAPGRWNTMTASWGGFGSLWNADAAFVFVRPSRHSFGFMEKEEGFTLSFFEPSMRKALQVCGSVSGRDVDKAEAAGITPRPFSTDGVAQRVAFAEAVLVLSCRKLFSQGIDPDGFVDPALSAFYPEGDVHKLYVGAIEGAWTRAAAEEDPER